MGWFGQSGSAAASEVWRFAWARGGGVVGGKGGGGIAYDINPCPTSSVVAFGVLVSEDNGDRDHHAQQTAPEES